MSNFWQSIFEFAKENPTAATAIVGVVVVIVPGAVGLITSRWTASTEMTKLSVGGQQKVFEQILDDRLARYPELYWLLSAFRKSTETKRPRTLDHTATSRLLTAANNWDSHNALFLGREAANTCALFRKELKTLSDTMERENRIAREEEIDALVSHSTRLELALRSDLGIYGIDRVATGQVLTRLPKNWG